MYQTSLYSISLDNQLMNSRRLKSKKVVEALRPTAYHKDN
jgi:hypothetical protein